MNCWPNTFEAKSPALDVLCYAVGIGTYTTAEDGDRFYGTRLPNVKEVGIAHFAVVEKYSGEVYAAYILHTNTDGVTYGTRVQYGALQDAVTTIVKGCFA